MTAHASLAPSASDKWRMCPGYVRAIAGLPDETSEPAAEGTAAHQVSEACLALGLNAHDFIGQTLEVEGFTFTWSDTDADLLQYGIDAVRAMGGQFYGERRVDLSRWLGPNQFGTLDRGIVTDDLIVVNDLKWGRVPVSPVRNPQLALYALGFWWEVARHVTETRNFKLIIDQPRSPGGGGEWDITLDELLAFGESAGAAAEASRTPNAPLIAGSWCRYCPAAKQKGGCGALDAFNLEVLGIAPDALDTGEEPAPLAEALTPERRGFLLLYRPQLKAWLDKIEADALADALDGYKIPLMKPVMGRRPPRKWRDDEAEQILINELGDDAVETKLKTPAKIEKLLGKTEFVERFDNLVDLGKASPILVPDGDARPELQNYSKMI